jgi:uncharacterized protein (DUF2141 family)
LLNYRFNGIIALNNLGTPKEGYGFSNQAEGIFGLGGFGDTCFHLTGSPKAKTEIITIVTKLTKSF